MTRDLPNGCSKPERPPPFQFGLKALLGTTLLFCIVVGLCSQFGRVGVVCSWFVLLALACAAGVWRRKLWEILASIALLFFSWCLLTPVLHSLQHRGRHPCNNNLKSISLALQNYCDKHGSFPPPYVADEDGVPMHSWRILILPFMDTYERDLYRQYCFDEPWYGPNNRKLADKMPSVYRCPSKRGKPGDFATDYVAVTGPNTVWPIDRRVRLSDVTDGTSNTVIVVESVGSGIHWMEPQDLGIDRIPMKINPKSVRGISSVHPGGVFVAFVDGSVQYLVDAMPSNTVKALLTRNDGQKVKLSDW